MYHHLIKYLKITFALFTFLGLTACGGAGGGGGGTAPNGVGGVFGPSQVALVEVSSAGTSSIDVSWLPATDSAALAGSIKYQVHAATQTTFTPDTLP